MLGNKWLVITPGFRAPTSLEVIELEYSDTSKLWIVNFEIRGEFGEVRGGFGVGGSESNLIILPFKVTCVSSSFEYLIDTFWLLQKVSPRRIRFREICSLRIKKVWSIIWKDSSWFWICNRNEIDPNTAFFSVLVAEVTLYITVLFNIFPWIPSCF